MIANKIEFDNTSAVLCARMVALDKDTREQAAIDAEAVLAGLPKFLRNSPHCRNEIGAMRTLISRALAKK